MIKVKRYITCILIFAMVLTSAVTMTVGEVNAAAKGTMEAMLEEVQKYPVGSSLAKVKSLMPNKGANTWRPGYGGAWCAWYVCACAKNVGLMGKAIVDDERNITVRYLLANVINAGGTAQFLEEKYKNNAANSISFNGKGSYKIVKSRNKFDPHVGDLVFYDWSDTPYLLDHVGIVVGVNPLRTVEGNTGKAGLMNHFNLDLKENAYRKNQVVAYVTPNYQSFTAKYNAGCSDAWGGMPPTTMPYGIQTPLSANQYIRNGYDFAGWTAQRDDGTWFYFNPSNQNQSGWYKAGAAPSGWKKYIYRDKQTVAKTHNKNKGVVTFYAQWSKTSRHHFYYEVNNSIGFQPVIRVGKGDSFTITKSKPTKSGYTFTGWAAYRVKDMKYFVSGKGWFTEKEIQNKGYSKKLYPAGGTYAFTGSWTNGCSGNSHYILEAQWKKNPVTTFTVKYEANGGTGSMGNTTVTYGTPTALRSNQFKREGYTFLGWTARRDDGTWRYYNPKNTSQERWCKEGQAPSGWKKYVYGNQAKVSKTYAKNKGVVHFCAEWKKNEPQTFTIKYNANGGKGTMANTIVTYGIKTPLRNNQFVKDGYKFAGWTAKRDNNTWRYIQPNGSKDGWYAEGKQPSGWKKYVYRNQENVLHTYNKNKGVVTFYAQWEKAPVHTFYYDTKGGTVTPPSIQVAEGTKFTLTQTIPEKEGCTFDGWTVRRIADNKCYVTGKGWFTDAEIKSKGYTKRIYTPGEGYTLDAAWTSGYSGVSNYTFEAQWKEIPAEQMHQITFDAMGGKGDYETLFVQTGEKIVIPFTVPEKDGYDFLGWAVYRVSDGKYFSLEEGWRTPQVISQKGLSKKLYPADSWYNLNDSWTYGCQEISDYVFEAQWEKNASQEPVEKPDTPQPPISEPEVIGYVSESEYYAKYAGNGDYDVTTYYRYATRQKEYTESTASSMAGWTLYNQVTTPGSSTWSKTKPASGAYETGYRYYCWGWEHKGDWTFYYDDNYNDAVAWIKKNYTVWNSNQFRYFWQVYSTNKGSSVKVSQTVNYRDSAGKTGTKAISDTKLWYEGVVYRQKASTKYQYWRWSDWSAWSGWSTQKQATGDTVKEERQYYVVKK